MYTLWSCHPVCQEFLESLNLILFDFLNRFGRIKKFDVPNFFKSATYRSLVSMFHSLEKSLGIIIKSCYHSGDLVLLIIVEFVTKEVAYNTLTLISQFFLQCSPRSISHFPLLFIRNLLELINNGVIIDFHKISLIFNMILNWISNNRFKNRFKIDGR